MINLLIRVKSIALLIKIKILSKATIQKMGKVSSYLMDHNILYENENK